MESLAKIGTVMNPTRCLLLILIGACALNGAGCAKNKFKRPAYKAPVSPTAAKPTAEKQGDKVVVTPVLGLTGKVVRVNQPGQFVIITFHGGQKPTPEQKLSVYRSELKVGEVRVTGTPLGPNAAADITAGEAKDGDDVRPE